MMVLRDSSQAHPHVEKKRKLYTEFPEEHPEHHTDRVGRLLRHLCDVRDTVRNFELEMEETCVARGAAWALHYPCTFKSGSKATHRLSFLHHGDDFLIVGTRVEVKEMTAQICSIFIVMVRRTSRPGDDAMNSISMLNVYSVGRMEQRRNESDANTMRILDIVKCCWYKRACLQRHVSQHRSRKLVLMNPRWHLWETMRSNPQKRSHETWLLPSGPS